MAIPASLTDQINNIKSSEVSYRIFQDKANIIDNNTNKVIEIPYMNIIDKYRFVLSNIVQNLTLDDALYSEYLYKPKMLSYDLYGTTELWFELLRLNGWSTIIEFKPKKIKVYRPDKFKSFINEILILEKRL